MKERDGREAGAYSTPTGSLLNLNCPQDFQAPHRPRKRAPWERFWRRWRGPDIKAIFFCCRSQAISACEWGTWGRNVKHATIFTGSDWAQHSHVHRKCVQPPLPWWCPITGVEYWTDQNSIPNYWNDVAGCGVLNTWTASPGFSVYSWLHLHCRVHSLSKEALGMQFRETQAQYIMVFIRFYWQLRVR